MSRGVAIWFAFAIAFSASVLSACRADESVLDAIFPCDLDGADGQCGTDENGQPMTCYVGSAQLGGQAFCTKRCDPEGDAPSGFVCTSSGALLETCDPNPEKEDPCQDPLQCYRTDVLIDQGICLWVPVCPYKHGSATELDASQCQFSHQLCAGTLLRGLSSLPIRVNNLHCIADRCDQGLPCPTTTKPVEVCPTEFYNPPLPVTCAVRCDKFTCPPNYACIASPNSGSPPVCLPGIIGMRCSSDEDCLAGVCIDTGAGFSLCTPAGGCNSEADCRLLGTKPPFACAEGIPDGDSYCFSTVPFHGANCEINDQCSAELQCGDEPCPHRTCSDYSPYVLTPSHGECRFDCVREDGCPAFGGLPHACLPDGSCYPGTFSVPCQKPTDCVESLVCASVPPDERSRSNDPKTCTASCDTDDDCDAELNPWLGPGYCVPSPEAAPGTVGFCRLGAPAGLPCDKPEHCASRCCLLRDDGMKTCGDDGSCVPEEP
jgi:hypothetical protein